METLTPKDLWSKTVNESQFYITLLTAVAPIIARHSQQVRTDPSAPSFEDIGSDHERFLKSLAFRLGELSEYFDDVFLTLNFLQVDKSKIAALYGEAMEPEQYYKYHYDNYLIRMVTVLDICAKFGNLLYGLGVPESKMYPNRFYDHPRLKDKPAGIELRQFSGYLDRIKKDRHRKVHRGASRENRFDDVLFWEGLNKAIGTAPENHDPLLDEITLTQIEEVLSTIRTTTRQSIAYVGDFLNSCLPQLQAILARPA